MRPSVLHSACALYSLRNTYSHSPSDYYVIVTGWPRMHSGPGESPPGAGAVPGARESDMPAPQPGAAGPGQVPRGQVPNCAWQAPAIPDHRCLHRPGVRSSCSQPLWLWPLRSQQQCKSFSSYIAGSACPLMKQQDTMHELCGSRKPNDCQRVPVGTWCNSRRMPNHGNQSISYAHATWIECDKRRRQGSQNW